MCYELMGIKLWKIWRGEYLSHLGVYFTSLPYFSNGAIHFHYLVISLPLMAKKNPRWSPRNSVLTFPHQTAVISSASSRSPCFCFFRTPCLSHLLENEFIPYIRDVRFCRQPSREKCIMSQPL